MPRQRQRDQRQRKEYTRDVVDNASGTADCEKGKQRYKTDDICCHVYIGRPTHVMEVAIRFHLFTCSSCTSDRSRVPNAAIARFLPTGLDTLAIITDRANEALRKP